MLLLLWSWRFIFDFGNKYTVIKNSKFEVRLLIFSLSFQIIQQPLSLFKVKQDGTVKKRMNEHQTQTSKQGFGKFYFMIMALK